MGRRIPLGIVSGALGRGDPPGERGVAPNTTMCKLMCNSLHGNPTMATNLALDPELLDRALAVSGEKSKKAAVTKALKEFIARREQRRLGELFGTLEWDPRYDYKAGRLRR